MEKIEFVNHSGGAAGADTWFELEGARYGVKTVAYSFSGHSTNSKNAKKLNDLELEEGLRKVLITAPSINRDITYQTRYVRNLLSRNWFQVKNSDAIYAVASFQNNPHTIVNGGTGWAVQMAIDSCKNVYVFDQNQSKWFAYDYVQKRFRPLAQIPKLTPHFAGIGSRTLHETGAVAITELYEFNLHKI